MCNKLYTLNEHCQRILKMFERSKPCDCCPASSDFADYNKDFADWEGNQCVVCREFVDVDRPGAWSCPCIILGKDEAIKRTWINLEEKGYI